MNHDWVKIGENTDGDVLWCTDCGAVQDADGKNFKCPELSCGVDTCTPLDDGKR